MKKQHRLTPWYPPEIKPVRIGVYEICAPIRSATVFQHWNGLWFGYFSITPDGAEKYRNNKGSWQDGVWRGLKGVE